MKYLRRLRVAGRVDSSWDNVPPRGQEVKCSCGLWGFPAGAFGEGSFGGPEEL